MVTTADMRMFAFDCSRPCVDRMRRIASSHLLNVSYEKVLIRRHYSADANAPYMSLEPASLSRRTGRMRLGGFDSSGKQ